MATKAFSFAGKLWIGGLNASGYPTALRHVGNVQRGVLALETTRTDIPSNLSCNRGILKSVETGRSARVQIQFDELQDISLEIGLRAPKVARTGTTVTNETFTPSSGVAVGDVFATKFQKISAITVKDSAGSPATLVAGTDYSVESAEGGLIKILNLGAFTFPLKIDYTYASATVYPIMKATATSQWCKVVQENVADNCAVSVVDIFSVDFSPSNQFNFLTTEIGNLPVEGTANEVSSFEADASFAQLGKFGRYVTL